MFVLTVLVYGLLLPGSTQGSAASDCACALQTREASDMNVLGNTNGVLTTIQWPREHSSRALTVQCVAVQHNCFNRLNRCRHTCQAAVEDC